MLQFSFNRHRLWAMLLLILPFALAACTLPTANTEDDTPQISGVPQVTMVAPFPNATYSAGVPVIVQASISNAGTDISRVEIAVDGTVIATLTTPNSAGASIFSITETWTDTVPGQYLISVTAFREDGSSSTPATATVNVIDPQTLADDDTPTEDSGDNGNNAQAAGDGTGNDNVTQSGDDASEGENAGDDPPAADPTPQPTSTPRPTNTPQPEPTEPEVADPPTPSVPTARFSVGTNVRSGPGTIYAPPIGAFPANSTTEILALNLDGTWMRVRYAGGDGWILASLVDVEGNISGLPREAGPPPPAPTNTPPPAATATPTGAVNLAFANDSVVSNTPVCNEQFTVTITVVNNGTAQSGTGRILVEDVYTAEGVVRATYDGGLLPPGGLAPEQTHTIVAPLTVSANFDEGHFIRIRIDPDLQIPESNEGDNEQQIPYILERGAC